MCLEWPARRLSGRIRKVFTVVTMGLYAHGAYFPRLWKIGLQTSDLSCEWIIRFTLVVIISHRRDHVGVHAPDLSCAIMMIILFPIVKIILFPIVVIMLRFTAFPVIYHEPADRGRATTLSPRWPILRVMGTRSRMAPDPFPRLGREAGWRPNRHQDGARSVTTEPSPGRRPITTPALDHQGGARYYRRRSLTRQ